ncbi:hypothetical protein [Asanoa ferruginea]|uniref:hypothetical protein n=1 Tax=Asanoa ferruginea TaxID=53367 RepID=UPI003144D7B6
MASLVNREFSTEFEGTRGGSVNVRIPASLTAQSRNLGVLTAYQTSDLVQATQPVVLTNDFYSRVALADSDLTLSVTSYARDVLLPQSLSIAAGVENMVVSKLQTVAADTTLGSAYDPTDKAQVLDFLVDVRAALRALSAPETGLNVVLSVPAYAAMLKAIGGASYDQGVGDLASGKVVRVAGLNVAESNRLDTGEAIAFHRDAITLAMQAPAAARGADSANGQADQSVPIRIVRAFDNATGAHVSLVNVFAGTALMTANVEGTSKNWTIRVEAAG